MRGCRDALALPRKGRGGEGGEGAAGARWARSRPEIGNAGRAWRSPAFEISPARTSQSYSPFSIYSFSLFSSLNYFVVKLVGLALATHFCFLVCKLYATHVELCFVSLTFDEQLASILSSLLELLFLSAKHS